MRRRSALPGFAPAISVTFAWLGLIVLLPLASLAVRPWTLGRAGIWHSIAEPRVVAALRLSFGTAGLAAAINVPFGLLADWVLARYQFRGRNFVDSLIDLPLALRRATSACHGPTAAPASAAMRAASGPETAAKSAASAAESWEGQRRGGGKGSRARRARIPCVRPQRRGRPGWRCRVTLRPAAA